MAGADYYGCDVCHAKTFYDAELDYQDWRVGFANENPDTKHPWPAGNVGWMVVLCKKCAESHDVVIKGATP